ASSAGSRRREPVKSTSSPRTPLGGCREGVTTACHRPRYSGAMEDLLLGPWAKSLPPLAWGMTQRELLASRPRLSAFATPLLTIDRAATRHNVALMGSWLDERGLRIAPHGKTTMAP